ncbi:unnamed protein product [Calypogeia fissa]
MDVWREEDDVCIGRRVAVVGDYGLLGQWLVRKLLEKGYYVHSALGCSPEEVEEMMALPCAEQLLELRRRDLLDYTSITDVIEGCSAVFLTIPPCDSLNGLPHYPVSDDPILGKEVGAPDDERETFAPSRFKAHPKSSRV